MLRKRASYYWRVDLAKRVIVACKGHTSGALLLTVSEDGAWFQHDNSAAFYYRVQHVYRGDPCSNQLAT